jgi:effector-binding domain-containing protein
MRPQMAAEDGDMTELRAGFAVALAMAVLVGVSVPGALAQGRNPAEAARASGEFGLEVTLPERTMLFLSGNGKWESAFETLVDAFKTVYAYLETSGLQPSGRAMMIYTAADDLGFSFQAAVPIAAAPAAPPQGDIAVGPAPSGKAYKFVHRGAYDTMDNTYEAITNFFDERNMDAKDMFIEEYETDPRTTPEAELVINVLVPVK